MENQGQEVVDEDAPVNPSTRISASSAAHSASSSTAPSALSSTAPSASSTAPSTSCSTAPSASSDPDKTLSNSVSRTFTSSSTPTLTGPAAPTHKHTRTRSELDDVKPVIGPPVRNLFYAGSRPQSRSSQNNEKRDGDAPGTLCLNGRELSDDLILIPSPEKVDPDPVPQKYLRRLNSLRLALRIGVLFAGGISTGVIGNVLHSLSPLDHWEIDPSALDEAPVLRLLCCSVFTLVVELIFVFSTIISKTFRKCEVEGTAVFLGVAALVLAGVNAGIGGHALVESRESPMGTAFEICNLKHKCKISALERPDYPFLCGEIKTSISSLLIISVFEFLIFASVLASLFARKNCRGKIERLGATTNEIPTSASTSNAPSS